MKRCLFVLVIGIMLVLPGAARADGSWLDQDQPPAWNQPRMSLPIAPASDPTASNPRCAGLQRPAETDADRAVVEAGWSLVGAYEGGWGMQVLTGASGYDGMCRPLGYQEFVFVDGLFAGTVSPLLMDSRTDGAAGQPYISGAGEAGVNFSRYQPSDALCCPSAVTYATFRIDSTTGAPVLLLDSKYTQPTASSGAPPSSESALLHN